MPSAVTTDRLQYPEIKLDGTALAADLALTHLRVERSLWVPSRATLRIEDPDFKVTDSGKFAIAAALTIGIVDIAGKATTVFQGEITDVTLEQGTGRRHELVVGALDKAHRLATVNNFRTWTKQKWSDIAKAVVSGAGLTVGTVDATDYELPYVIQRTNDFAFLSELAQRVGFDWWVDDGKVYIQKSPTTSGPTLTFGDDLIDFKVRYSGAVKGKKITVQGWDPATQKAVTGNDGSTLSGSSQPAISSTAPLVTDGRKKAISGWAKDLNVAALHATTTVEAGELAKGLATQIDATEVFARGLALATPTLEPGKNVEIEGMGKKASGKYYVTSVEHVFGEGGGSETRFTAGNKAPVGLADVLGGATASPTWGASGLIVGIVTNVNDPDKLGKVKVKFPTFSAKDESAWARVAAIGAGKDRGIEWLPEVDDEVIVGFEQGDPHHPVVLGGLWSAKNTAPITTEIGSAVKVRRLKTTAGHVIELSEDGDKEFVQILLKDGTTTLLLNKEKVELTSNKKPLKLTDGDAVVELNGSGNISVKGKKVSIDGGTGDVEIKGTNVKITAQANVQISASAQFKAEGKAGANLETTAIAVVKGSMVKIN